MQTNCNSIGFSRDGQAKIPRSRNTLLLANARPKVTILRDFQSFTAVDRFEKYHQALPGMRPRNCQRCDLSIPLGIWQQNHAGFGRDPAPDCAIGQTAGTHILLRSFPPYEPNHSSWGGRGTPASGRQICLQPECGLADGIKMHALRTICVRVYPPSTPATTEHGHSRASVLLAAVFARRNFPPRAASRTRDSPRSDAYTRAISHRDCGGLSHRRLPNGHRVIPTDDQKFSLAFLS